MLDSPTPPARNSVLKGIIFPNAAALILMLVIRLVSGAEGEAARNASSAAIFGSFFIVPFLVGVFSAYYWQHTQMKTGAYLGLSVLNSIITIALSAIFLREGVFCLLIVSPLIMILNIAGALIGKYIFKRRNKNVNISLAGLLLVLVVGDLASDHDHQRMISDVMVVNAPIEKVWPLVVEYEPITMEEDYWFFKIGMPSPVQSTVTGHEAGAGRKCIFSNGYVFDEKMIVYKPNEELTFDIVSQPRDPEIMGHIDILRGQFILKDNGDGTTTVIGNITRNVHLRVMKHIKVLAEKSV